ncbi:hypothetical protein [Methylocella sp.]|jgi:hypothetical protein|uniref:hypothetical protein n=1 Tax=Methylocella sp. TaxID=1978226 RepID=UPI003C21A1D9
MSEIASKSDHARPSPFSRQVLANIGNRYVTFGTRTTLPNVPVLGPGDVQNRYSARVGDEFDFPSERLVSSIQVNDADVVREPSNHDRPWDLELHYSGGRKALVEIKVQSRDLNIKAMDTYKALLQRVQSENATYAEVWHFNIERLRLWFMWLDEKNLPRFCELEPLNVFEFNADGTVFDRSDLIERIDDWLTRIAAIYDSASLWSGALQLTADKSRKVLMSEELMQKFAIPDKEIEILDINKDGEPILSFVPAGLWVIGSNGRIDIIGRNGTNLLLDSARSLEPPAWFVHFRRDKQSSPWTEETFQRLIEESGAPCVGWLQRSLLTIT